MPAIVEDSMLIRSDTHLYRIAKGYEVDALPKIASTAKRSRKGKEVAKKKPKRNSNSIVEVTAYYLGGKTNSKGVFEASFLIEDENLPKDEWPQVKFTGDNFRDSFSSYKQYQKVSLDLAKRQVRRKK
jgi:hypothetical protein